MGTSYRKFCHLNFEALQPHIRIQGGGAATGLDTTVSEVQAGNHWLEVRYEQDNTDTNFTAVDDADSCDGWQIPNDNTDNEGIEITFGQLLDASQLYAFKVGTDPAFYFKVKLGIPAVADYDVCAIGFRTTDGSTYTDAINSAAGLYAAYSGATDHVFGINIDQGDYKVFKTTNGTDVQDDVSVTDAVDDDTPVLEVRVSAAGAVSAYVDGTAVTLTNAGTAFDTGDIVIPYMVFCKDDTAAADTPPILNYVEFGYQ